MGYLYTDPILSHDSSSSLAPIIYGLYFDTFGHSDLGSCKLCTGCLGRKDSKNATYWLR